MKRAGFAVILVSLSVVFVMASQSLSFAWFWEKGSIKGTVVDADNSANMLNGVRVMIEETGDSVVTNYYGEFRFKDLSSRNYTVSLKKEPFFPKTVTVQVASGEVADIKVKLARISVNGNGPFSARLWAQEASARLRELLVNRGMINQSIAIAFYKRMGQETCELPEMVLRFATAFNAMLGDDGNQVVIRDMQQASYLMTELREQRQFRVDFDPATVAKIGRRLGASIVIIGALLDREEYLEPLVNGTSVERQAYIPGLSISDILLQKDEAPCN